MGRLFFRGKILGNGPKCSIINGQGLKETTFNRPLVAILLDFFYFLTFILEENVLFEFREGREEKKSSNTIILAANMFFSLPFSKVYPKKFDSFKRVNI